MEVRIFFFVDDSTDFFFLRHFLGSLATLILPAGIYLKLMPTDSDLYNHARALFAFGMLVMLAVVSFTIVKVAA